MPRPLAIILATVILDAVGIGLIMPILPDLLRSLAGPGDISLTYGAMAALYALMQFLCAPVLGLLSDRLGRRPVLIASMLGAAVDYLFMTIAPHLWMLFLGRAIAGITAANLSVVTAYITDITPPEDRARRFGYFHAMFGIGFIVGPVLGGVLGDQWLRAPFLAAAVLNGLNAVIAARLLPETRTAAARAASATAYAGSVNPFRPIGRALAAPALLPMIGAFMMLYLVSQVYGSAWVLFGEERFTWSPTMVGASLAFYGVLHAGAQLLVTGPVVQRLGERNAMLLGAGTEVVALILTALATQGWVLFALCPLYALSGVTMPALQALATSRVGEDRQGELQGVLASLGSLTAAIGPLLFTGIYAATRLDWPGAVWAAAAALYLPVLLLVVRLQNRQQPGRATGVR